MILRKYFLIFFSSIFIISFSQVNISSPQCSEIQRFGNIPVNLAVGGIDLDIPLYNNDFNVNLNYNSSGFIPTKKSNYVGLNWFLNFGGSITREINDINDDLNSSDSNNIKGFLYFVKNRNLNDGDLYSLNLNSYLNVGGYYTELTSDRYNINFMGINGYFYINAQGKAVVMSNDPNLKIDIKNLNYQYAYTCTPEDSEIIITDGKGNKYYFGGNYNNLEISYNLGSLNGSNAVVSPAQYSIKGWFLRRIEYLNNRYINISYKKYSESLFDNLDSFCESKNIIPSKSINSFKSKFFDLNLIVDQKIYRGDYNFDLSIYGEHIWGSGSSFSWTAPYYQINLIKKVFPEIIDVNGTTTINFNYAELSSSYNEGYPILMLNDIKIYNKVNNIKEINFSYDRIKDYIFLKQINVQDQKYSFDYYNTQNLPNYKTFGIDHWGYWNGNSETSNPLIPKYSFNSSTGDYKTLGISRDPNPSLVNTALLSKINYPTGGITEFFYEPHSYSTRIDQNPKSNFYRTFVSENGQVGGARIQKIITKQDNTSSPIIKEFQYLNKSGLSSGILLNNIRYVYYNDYKNNGGGRTKQVFESNQNYLAGTFTNSPIEYERVLELQNSNLYKEYIYSSYKTNPDSLSYKISNENTYADFKPTNMNKNLELKYSDFGNRRRKTIKEIFFNSLGDSIKVVSYKYSYPIKQNTEYVSNQNIFNKQNTVAAIPLIYGTYYYINYFNHPLVNEIVEKSFFKGKEIKTKNAFFYNQNLNLKEEMMLYPESTKKTTYQYAHEKGNQYLIDKNMIGIPLQTTVTKNNIGISSVETKYPTSQTEANTKTSGLPLPTSVISYGLQMPGSSSSSKIELTYDQYDNKGNILQYTEKGLKPTVIIWGYNKTQPITKIEGAKYNDIKTLQVILDAITASDADVDAATEQSLLAKLDLLRTNSSLSNYNITTYTYDPLIGVTSITPPSGIREIYKYDSANRLQSVVDINGKILKEYRYNYKQ